jgi:tetratricopeptide (TPR) repeat protein
MTLVPGLVFAILEVSLRVAGYGKPTNFFLDGSKVERTQVWIDNPDFGYWVFPRGLEPFPQPVPFVLPKDKAAGTYRIFVLGESAAMGFPDPSTSFARVLEVMLRAQYPNTRFEVVNASMVAINSHIALPIAKQCAEHKPDLFIVHLGNNEVVGPFGAAGVLGPFSPSLRLIRANLGIKTTRTGQLLNGLVQALARGKDAPQGWDGMAMFTNSHVRVDDSRLPRIYDHFRQNLQDICRLGSEAGVPVVLCTIPVNLKDSAPFGSMHAPDLTDKQRQAWEKLYKAGVQLEGEKKFAEALKSYLQAGQIDNSFADLAFRLGRCYTAMEDDTQARQHYLGARDLDTLRFRSDTTINNTIREVAAANEAAGVRLADAEQVFARNSCGEVPGEELFLEHVHMNFKGNYLLARTVFDTITNPAPPALGTPSNQATPLSEEQCARRLAHTEWNESYHGTKTYELLLKGPPFTFQLDRVERAERWKQRLAELRERLKAGGIQPAIADYQQAIQAAEGDWMIRMNFAELLTEIGRAEEAVEQYEQVLVHLRHSFAARYKVGNLYLKMNSPQSAEFHFREALRLDPDNLEANVGLAEALESQGRTAQAQAMYEEQIRKHPNRAFALAALGRFLYRTGRFEDAKARLTEALQREPGAAATHVDLGLTALRLEKADEAIEHFEAALRIRPEWPELREQLAEARKKRDQGNRSDRN